MKWEIINREECYKGFFRIDKLQLRHSLYAGGWSPVIDRELMQHGSHSQAVAVLPYDPVRDEVVLIEQFRAGAIESPQGPWMLEIVAGLVEPGESKEDVAHREAQEEAGCTLTRLEHIYDYYPSPGGYQEEVALYLAQVDARGLGGIHGLSHEYEDIKVSVVSVAEAFSMVANGVIRSAIPMIALQWLQLNHRDLRAGWS